MSNFPLAYRLSWLPRLLKPSLAGAPVYRAPLDSPMRMPPGAATARLVFLGDISAVANREPPEIDPAIRQVLAAADLIVANCESPVVESPGFPLATRLGLRHAMTPAFLDGVLAAAGVVPGQLVLSLANNHALDQGMAGLEETRQALVARGIRVIGTSGAGLVEHVKAGPLAVGLLAFTAWRNADHSAFAGRVSMVSDIAGWQSASASGLALVCAVPHWDWEFRHFPRSETRALARSLVAQGVGLIAGHHAHVVQSAETIDGVPVAYGLGDFLGTALPRQPWPGRIGAMLLVDICADSGATDVIAICRMVPFLRMRQRTHERLVAVDSLEGAMATRVRERLELIFGVPAGGQLSRETL